MMVRLSTAINLGDYNDNRYTRRHLWRVIFLPKLVTVYADEVPTELMLDAATCGVRGDVLDSMRCMNARTHVIPITTTSGLYYLYVPSGLETFQGLWPRVGRNGLARCLRPTIGCMPNDIGEDP